MTIKAIQARFTSGNDIPVQKAMVPADEWHMAMAEIQVLKDEIIWDKMAFEKLEKLCDERGSNEAKMFTRCRELADQVGQLQEQNTMLDKKLAEVEKDAARYRWLAWKSDTNPIMPYDCENDRLYFGHECDAAIDAAMESK